MFSERGSKAMAWHPRSAPTSVKMPRFAPMSSMYGRSGVHGPAASSTIHSSGEPQKDQRCKWSEMTCGVGAAL